MHYVCVSVWARMITCAPLSEKKNHHVQRKALNTCHPHLTQYLTNIHRRHTVIATVRLWPDYAAWYLLPPTTTEQEIYTPAFMLFLVTAALFSLQEKSRFLSCNWPEISIFTLVNMEHRCAPKISQRLGMTWWLLNSKPLSQSGHQWTVRLLKPFWT